MTAPADPVMRPLTAQFGHGGSLPYETALALALPRLRLERVVDLRGSGPRDRRGGPGAGGHGDEPVVGHHVEVARFLAGPDRVDRAVLGRTTGPVLDVGCGPGRMVAEALRRGRAALGIDVSPTAVALAGRVGRPVLLQSVFDPVPGEGGWVTTLLLDGNIGIGGDPRALLARCAALTAPGGTVVVETHPEPARHACFQARLVDDRGVASAAFPWAQAGSRTVARLGAENGLVARATMRRGGRRFVLLHRQGPAPHQGVPR